MSILFERLRSASLGGVRFQVEDVADTTGRELARHHFPGIGQMAREDMGRLERSIQIEALIFGDDYVERSDALMRAAERPGPQRLVHPWVGDRLVRVEQASRRFEARAVRLARVALALVEEADLRLPQPQPLAGLRAALAAVQLAAETANDWIQGVQDFLSNPVPGFVRRAIGDGVAVIANALGAVTRARNIDPAAALFGQITGLRAAADAYGSGAESPEGLPSLVQAAVGSVYDAAGGGIGGLIALEELAAVKTKGQGAAGSAMGQLAERLEDQAVRQLSQAALAELVNRAAAYSWETYDQALEWRDRLLVLVDQAMARAEDPAFEALRVARTRLLDAVPPPDRTLPQLATYTPVGSLPVQVIAYELYGSIERSEELVRRNRISRPLIVRGGEPLEVLVIEPEEA